MRSFRISCVNPTYKISDRTLIRIAILGDRVLLIKQRFQLRDRGFKSLSHNPYCYPTHLKLADGSNQRRQVTSNSA